MLPPSCPATRTSPTRSTSTRWCCCGGRRTRRRCPDEELDALQARQLAYRAGLKRQGLLVANGPLGEQTDECMRGLSIYACDLAEAARLSDGDPSVQAGRLAYDLFEWWVAAGTLAFPNEGRPVGDRRSMPED